MRSAVIVWLFCWFSKFLKKSLLLIEHLSFSILWLKSSWEDCFSPLMLCFLNVDIRWMLIMLPWYSISRLLSSMHLMHVFSTKNIQIRLTTVTYRQVFFVIYLLLIVYGFVWPCKWISSYDASAELWMYKIL